MLGVFLSEEDSTYAEKYMSFLHIIGSTHPGIQQPKLLIADVIDFIPCQETPGARSHSRRIFRLSCLCLDEPRMSFAPVKFGTHRTADPLSPMFDVSAPIQSYLSYVSHGLDVLTSDSSVSRFLPLEQSFGNAGPSEIYSPWDSVDHFGRAQIRENLEPKRTSREAEPHVNVPVENAPL